MKLGECSAGRCFFAMSLAVAALASNGPAAGLPEQSTPDTFFHSGIAGMRKGDCEAAARNFTKAIQASTSSGARYAARAPAFWKALASADLCRGAYSGAEHAWKRAAELQLAADPRNAQLVEIYAGLGVLYARTGRLTEARATYEQARDIAPHVHAPDPNVISMLLCNMGALEFRERKAGRSEELLREALSIQRNSPGSDAEVTAGVLNNLARLLFDRKDYEEAEHLYAEAVAIIDASTGFSPQAAASTLANYAKCLRRTGSDEEAKRITEQAKSLAAKRPSSAEAGMVVDIGQLRRGK